MLILGAGAGGDVLLALHHGADQVDAVELNPQMVELLREPLRGLLRSACTKTSGSAMHVSEARGFVTRSGADLRL